MAMLDLGAYKTCCSCLFLRNSRLQHPGIIRVDVFLLKEREKTQSLCLSGVLGDVEKCDP